MRQLLHLILTAALCSCGVELETASISDGARLSDGITEANASAERTPNQRTWWVRSRACNSGTFVGEPQHERFIVGTHFIARKYDIALRRTGYCEMEETYSVRPAYAYSKQGRRVFASGRDKEERHTRDFSNALLDLVPVQKKKTCYDESGSIFFQKAEAWTGETTRIQFDVETDSAEIWMVNPSICRDGTYNGQLELRDDDAF